MSKNYVKKIETSKIKAFEGARGIAAIIIAFYHLHYGEIYFSIIQNGYLLVDLFFVLSGFVIYSSYSSRIVTVDDFKQFMIRRFGRLFPLLIFSSLSFVIAKNFQILIKYIIIFFGYGKLLKTTTDLNFMFPTVTEIIATFTLTHGLGFFDNAIINSVAWSISAEFYTYMLFGSVIYFFAKRSAFFVYIAIFTLSYTITVLGSILIYDCTISKSCLNVTYDFGFPRCIASFFLGVLICRANIKIKKNDTLIQMVSILLCCIIFTLLDNYPLLAFTFPFVFCLFVISISRDTGPIGTLLCQPLFQLLGKLSYSIYMLHNIILLFIPQTNNAIQQAVVLILYVVVLIIASYVSYKYIEDPFRKRFNLIAEKMIINNKKLGSHSPVQPVIPK